MTTEAFYKTLLTYIRKDTRGKSLTIDEFNELIPVVNYELYNQLYDEWEKNQNITDDMSPFKVIGESLIITATKGDLTGLDYTYEHLIGKPRYSTGTTIDVVTAFEYADRFNDGLTKPSLTYPVCYVADDAGDLTLYVYPTGTSPVLIDYLRAPATPFLDYYINDTTYVVTYMDDTAVAVSVPSGSTYSDGTAGPTTKTSTTSDIEFGNDLEGRLLDLFLAKLGVQQRDDLLIQYSNLEQQKQA